MKHLIKIFFLFVVTILHISLGHAAEDKPLLGQSVTSQVLAVKQNSNLSKDLVQKGLIKKGQVLLSLGSGTGDDEIFFSGMAKIVIASDIDGEILKALKEKSIGATNFYALYVDAVDRLPFCNNLFDLVYMRLLFHYFPDTVQNTLLGEIYRILKPGGLVVIQSIAKKQYTGKEATDKGGGMFEYLEVSKKNNKPYIRNLVAEDDLKAKLRSANFRLTEKIKETKERLYADDHDSILLTAIGKKLAKPQ